MKKSVLLLSVLVVLSFPFIGWGAETVHLYLKANGKDIKGESTQISLGRADSIECVYYQQSVQTSREASSGMATGRRQFEPIMITKRIDKSSPLLQRALANNEKIDAMFKFFRPNPQGDGTTQQFYTVVISNARIASIKQMSPDTIKPATSSDPPTEDVTFAYGKIQYLYVDGGVMFEDTAWGK